MNRPVTAMALIGLLTVSASAAEPPLLALEVKIPLGEVSGRMDYFAMDRHGQGLFLPEFGNDTVSVIDLRARAVVRRITGLRTPSTT